MRRYPIIFPYVEVNQTTVPKDVASQVSRMFDHSGIVELILADRTARVRCLYALAQLGTREKVSAEIAPRRRDWRARVLIAKGAFVSDREEFEVLKVAAKTDATKLAESMRIAMFGSYKDDPHQSNVELRAVGPGSAANAMFALEQLRFESWRDIRFTARFEQLREGQGLIITVGVCSSKPEGDVAEDGEVEGEPVDELEDADLNGPSAMPQVRWAPLLNPDTFPTVFIGNRTGTMRLGTYLAASLSVRTTRVMELVLLDKAQRAKLIYTVAALPPWVEAAAQVAARRADSRGRFRVLKDYPLQGRPRKGAMVLRVSSSTEPERLAKAIYANLLDEDSPEESLLMELLGPEAATRAVLALEHFQAMSKREVTFWPRFQPMKEGRPDVVRGIELTVAAT